MEFETVEGFDREQWSTVHVDRLKKGDVFRFPNDSSDSVVSVPPHPYEEDGAAWVRFTTRNARTGIREGNSIYRATTSVLIRCDIKAVF
ncbi:hypothetical protein [Streptomyces sp. I8-5]|uniref:hypothetical protein n=1 Tax=Streptomyces sp. I8-5 TaxID=3104277 RepID=UPI00386C2FF5